MLAKRLAAFGAALLLTLTGATAVNADEQPASAAEEPIEAPVAAPVVTADDTQVSLFGAQAMLMCAENGQVLLERDADLQVHPASVTKLMTALLVFENCPDLTKMTTVSYAACHELERGSTHIALDTGEEVTLEQMMYAMLITSANDAANVLAEEVAGSQAAFAKMMTERAIALGCENTHFTNAHGLDDAAHYTSARDMARITQALLEYDRFAEISQTDVYQMSPTNKQSEARQFWNKQNILRASSKFYYEDAIAGKNGWTTAAGQTLVTVARRDGVTLIAITFGANENRFDKHRDTLAMFEYGYNNFSATTVTAAAQAQAAEAAGISTDPDALVDTLVLMPVGGSKPVLTATAEGLSIGDGTRALLTCTLPPAAAQDVVAEQPLPKPEPTPETPQQVSVLTQVLRVGGIALAALLVLFLCFYVHRQRQIRRKRAYQRARRRRAAEEARAHRSKPDDDLYLY